MQGPSLWITFDHAFTIKANVTEDYFRVFNIKSILLAQILSEDLVA